MIAIVAVFSLVAMIIGKGWYYARSEAVLRKWAKKKGLRLTHCEYRYGLMPLKWWANNRLRPVYYIKVRDRSGQERSGLARCGNIFGGVVSSSQVEVRWDEP